MKIAVIGSGISGLGSSWILSAKHEVHLFESDSRLGGHAHTVPVVESTGSTVPVDTGFLVYNELTYPHLKAFFKKLGVTTANSDMSLAIRADHKDLEWAGANLDTVFAQRRNILKPRFLRMIRDILRFQKEAEENLKLSQLNQWTLGQLLKYRRYSSEFSQDYLLPIGAAIWSTPELNMEDFPAETFIGFFINHRLLQISNRPIWRTVQNGSSEYVKRVSSLIPHIHLNAPVTRAERRDGRVLLQVGGESLWFDKVVFATHAPITRRILKMENAFEDRVLGAIETRPSQTLLHQDEQLMPRYRKCWSSWNVFSSPVAQGPCDVTLTYYLNKLQPLNTSKSYFVTLNPRTKVEKVLKTMTYHHPQFDVKALQAQRLLPLLQGNGGVYFAGAWTRHGFHEDGLLSAVKVGALFDIKPPWEVS